MDVKYHKWLECEVTHNYFKDGVSSIFGLIPFQHSGRQMANYSVLLNNQRNSFSLFCGINGDAELDVQTQFEGITDLYFQLAVFDYSFFNYTNLKGNSADEIYLFSNANTSGSGQKLHEGEFASEAEKIKLRQAMSNYTIPQSDVKLEIKSGDGTVVMENEYSGNQPTNILLDLQNQEVGIYHLWLNGEMKESFFLVNQSLEPTCIGILRINMESMIKNYVEDMKYGIGFDSRSAYWMYKVIVDPAKTIADLNITGIATETYLGPVEEDFMNNQKAFVFTSDVPLPLRQTLDKSPVLHITYSSEFTDEDSMELKLPNPSVETISTKTNEQDEISFYSSSIIYV